MFRGLALVTFLITIGLKASEAEELRLFGDGSKIVQHSAEPLSSTQRRQLRQLSREGEYFGAVVIIPKTDKFAWAYGFHDVSIARSYVMELCKVETREVGLDPSSCTLYASIIPESVSPEGSRLSGLSEAAAEIFVQYRSDHRAGGHGAFAISGLTEFWGQQNVSSATTARNEALQGCTRSVDFTFSTWRPELVRWARTHGLDRCRIVNHMGP
jgi:hypothetical protein